MSYSTRRDFHLTALAHAIYVQFDPTESSVEAEKKNNLALLAKLGNSTKRARHEGGDDALNVRKAVRFASKGAGGAALARKMESSEKGKRKKGKR